MVWQGSRAPPRLETAVGKGMRGDKATGLHSELGGKAAPGVELVYVTAECCSQEPRTNSAFSLRIGAPGMHRIPAQGQLLPEMLLGCRLSPDGFSQPRLFQK